LDISAHFRNPLLDFGYASVHFTFGIQSNFLELFQGYCQQCEALPDIIVKLSGDAGAFCLLRLDQSPRYAGEDFFSAFAFGNVRDHPEETRMPLRRASARAARCKVRL
jgi:hypothetical protein